MRLRDYFKMTAFRANQLARDTEKKNHKKKRRKILGILKDINREIRRVSLQGYYSCSGRIDFDKASTIRRLLKDRGFRVVRHTNLFSSTMGVSYTIHWDTLYRG